MPARYVERGHQSADEHITHWIGGAPRESANELVARVRERTCRLRVGPGGQSHVHGTEGVHFYTRTKAVMARWADPAARPLDGVDLGFATNG